MKILCFNYSITVPNKDVVRIVPDKNNTLGMQLVISSTANYKYVLYTCTPCLAMPDKISDDRWSVDLEKIYEIRLFDN